MGSRVPPRSRRRRSRRRSRRPPTVNFAATAAIHAGRRHRTCCVVPSSIAHSLHSATWKILSIRSESIVGRRRTDECVSVTNHARRGRYVSGHSTRTLLPSDATAAGGFTPLKVNELSNRPSAAAESVGSALFLSRSALDATQNDAAAGLARSFALRRRSVYRAFSKYVQRPVARPQFFFFFVQ